jgi:hypothetical protein
VTTSEPSVLGVVTCHVAPLLLVGVTPRGQQPDGVLSESDMLCDLKSVFYALDCWASA